MHTLSFLSIMVCYALFIYFYLLFFHFLVPVLFFLLYYLHLLFFMFLFFYFPTSYITVNLNFLIFSYSCVPFPIFLFSFFLSFYLSSFHPYFFFKYFPSIFYSDLTSICNYSLFSSITLFYRMSSYILSSQLIFVCCTFPNFITHYYFYFLHSTPSYSASLFPILLLPSFFCFSATPSPSLSCFHVPQRLGNRRSD